MTVLEYFKTIFPNYVGLLDQDLRQDPESRIILEEMPINSGCGRDCVHALHAAHSFLREIETAYGPGTHVAKTAVKIAVGICCTFIRG